MKRLPLTVQNAYIDLLERLEEGAVVGIGGQPVLRTVAGRKYWYSRLYAGTEEREQYLGPDTPEIRAHLERFNKYWYARVNVDTEDWMQYLGHGTPGSHARLERLKDEQEKRREWDESKRALVKTMQAQEVPRIDVTACEALQALARAGAFQLRAVLVGAHAFQLYPLVLGTVIPEAYQTTDHADVARLHEVSVGVGSQVNLKTEHAFAQVGTFTPAASLYPTQPAGYRIADTLVEILTPNHGSGPLQFFDFLLSEAISAAIPYRYGVLVNVPRPARFAIYKLIVSTQRARTDATKGRKDTEQAMALIPVLAKDKPYELARVYREAHNRGELWRQALIQGVNRMSPETKHVLQDVLAAPKA